MHRNKNRIKKYVIIVSLITKRQKKNLQKILHAFLDSTPHRLCAKKIKRVFFRGGVRVGQSRTVRVGRSDLDGCPTLLARPTFVRLSDFFGCPTFVRLFQRNSTNMVAVWRVFIHLADWSTFVRFFSTTVRLFFDVFPTFVRLCPTFSYDS